MALSAATRERMRAWLTRAMTVFLLVLISYVTLGGISHNDHFRINTIYVTGEAITAEADIRALVQNELLGNYFFVFARDNSSLYPKQEIVRAIIKQFPRVESVQVTHADAHTISVSISERKPYALWCGADFQSGSQQTAPCWFIDHTGLVYDQAPLFSDGVYVEMYGGLETGSSTSPTGNIISSAPFLKAQELIQSIQSEIGTPLRVVFDQNGEYEVTMYASDQYPMLHDAVVRLGADMVPATVVTDLSAAIQEEFQGGTIRKKLLYIDMRFGNKIFFGF